MLNVKITYTSPVRGHQFSYAEALNKLGVLHAFVTGASRFGYAAMSPELGNRLMRHDFWQTLHLACFKFSMPDGPKRVTGRLANNRIDKAAFKPASASDVFLYYRTTGLTTVARLKARGSRTLCVLEEVNSHVKVFQNLMREECEKLGYMRHSVSRRDTDLLLRAYDEADLILCPSSFVKRSFESQGFASNKLAMVNFGFGLKNHASRARNECNGDGVFRMLYVGQLHYRKGVRYAVEAFKRLRHPRKELLIVGPMTPTSGLEKTSMPAGVRFAGVLKGEDLQAAYNAASVFVLPTLEDGSALVQAEAMAVGLPVITTTHSGGDDFITDREQGLVVPPADVDALTDALQELADSPELCSKLGEAALTRAREMGGWDVAAGKLVAAFEHAMLSRGQSNQAPCLVSAQAAE